LFVAAVAGLLIYVPLSLAGQRNNYRDMQNDIPPVIDENIPCPQPVDRPRFELLKRFLANSTPVEIRGNVVRLVKRLLVLNTERGQVRIHLPLTWIVEEQELEREDLFEIDYLTIGQNITVKALKGTLVTKEVYSIYVLFGYEIINANSVHAYAVLPFNIETL